MQTTLRIVSSLKAECAHPAWIEIDTKQFRKNLSVIRQKIGRRLFCLPIKANAYGHGLYQIAKIAEKEGVNYLGVSCLKEGIELRLKGISKPILILGAIHEDQIADLIALDLEFTISSKYKAELVAQRCKERRRKCRVHLEIDTGMRRTGVRPENAMDLLSFVEKLGCFEIVGFYSHLATADLPNDPFAIEQIEIFSTLVKQVAPLGILCHLANSGGILNYTDSYFDMVRPGLFAYGYFPDGRKDSSWEIAPCLSLKARISYFKVVAAGSGISYGHEYRTKEESRIVTVPLGYGDGYRKSLSRGEVLIRGNRFPIAGAICMDQFMVDIGKKEAFVGDEVVLIGKQGKEEISLWELARLAGSIPYEMLSLLSDRLPRIFL